MKIVIAPDSFKESLSAKAAADAIARGFQAVFREATIVQVPLADGGEGTMETLVDALGGQLIPARVSDPLGRPIEAHFGLLGDGSTAIIEIAAASGLARVSPAERNPLLTSTRGTGELIRTALDTGARRILIGLGGSATNDGGVGMAQALGFRFVRHDGTEIAPGGASLAELDRILLHDVDPRLAYTEFIAACDVDHPLIGEQGASAVFGPQKGATPTMVQQLDKALTHLAWRIREDLHCDVADKPGAGAAGGLGAGVLAFLGGKLQRGVDMVIDAVGLPSHIQDADLVITGEGRIDEQTLHGKTLSGVARIVHSHGVPVIAIGGSLGPGSESLQLLGMDMLFSLVPGVCTLEEACRHASSNLERTALHIARVLQCGQRLS